MNIRNHAEYTSLKAHNEATVIELNNLNTELHLAKIRRIDAAIATADGSLMGGIFGMFTSEASKEFLTQTGHVFLFPWAAAASLARMGLAWREAYITRKAGTVVNAGVETIAALGVTTAVVGGIVAASIFGAVSPLIFTGVMAFKSLYHAASSIYNLSKAAVAIPEDKPKYKARAKAHAMGAVTGLIFTAAVATVMVLAKPAMAFLGIIGSVIGVALGISKGVKQYKEAKKLQAEVEQVEEREFVSSGNRIARGLNLDLNAAATATAEVKQDASLSASRKMFDRKKAPENDAQQERASHQRSHSL